MLFLILGGLAKLRKLFLTRLYSNCSHTPDFRPLLDKGFKGLYQHLIQNENQKLLTDWQSRYVTFYPAFAVYGNGLNS